MKTDEKCINCGQGLIGLNGTTICPRCNTEDLTEAAIFVDSDSAEPHLFIDCPGATLYADGTNEIIAGVKYFDDDDVSQGHTIIDHAVFAPTHKAKRRINKEALGKIRRCQGCQDLTVRMRRREGPDFCVPSVKYPRRKRLKPAAYRTFA